MIHYVVSFYGEDENLLKLKQWFDDCENSTVEHSLYLFTNGKVELNCKGMTVNYVSEVISGTQFGEKPIIVCTFDLKKADSSAYYRTVNKLFDSIIEQLELSGKIYYLYLFVNDAILIDFGAYDPKNLRKSNYICRVHLQKESIKFYDKRIVDTVFGYKSKIKAVEDYENCGNLDDVFFEKKASSIKKSLKLFSLYELKDITTTRQVIKPFEVFVKLIERR